jgi:hypothetical protein
VWIVGSDRCGGQVRAKRRAAHHFSTNASREREKWMQLKAGEASEGEAYSRTPQPSESEA